MTRTTDEILDQLRLAARRHWIGRRDGEADMLATAAVLMLPLFDSIASSPGIGDSLQGMVDDVKGGSDAGEALAATAGTLQAEVERIKYEVTETLVRIAALPGFPRG